jgi:hypothetical protein
MESLHRLSEALNVSVEWLLHGHNRSFDGASDLEKIPSTRKAIESQLVSLSKHVPISYLINIVSLLESAKIYLDV